MLIRNIAKRGITIVQSTTVIVQGTKRKTVTILKSLETTIKIFCKITKSLISYIYHTKTNDLREENDQWYQTQQINEDKRSNFTIIHIYSYNYELRDQQKRVACMQIGIYLADYFVLYVRSCWRAHYSQKWGSKITLLWFRSPQTAFFTQSWQWWQTELTAKLNWVLPLTPVSVAAKLQQCKAIEDPTWLGTPLPSIQQIFLITLHHQWCTDTIAGLSTYHLAELVRRR